ncbi:LOW QUALITY PROTEIN: vascular non-inflammatory molecule 3-like [Rhynchonycteris naso]
MQGDASIPVRHQASWVDGLRLNKFNARLIYEQNLILGLATWRGVQRLGYLCKLRDPKPEVSNCSKKFLNSSLDGGDWDLKNYLYTTGRETVNKSTLTAALGSLMQVELMEEEGMEEIIKIPPQQSIRFGYAPVQERLSCLAKDNSIYIMANIGDKKPCNASDPQCPLDGCYQYHSNVMFDSEGRLVARYHKYNLFAPEIQFDFPTDSEFVTFNTPFGKFGIFTCFDILFYNLAVMLVNKFPVDSVIFYTTAWYNLLPFFSAVSFHSAWTRTRGVNLLAANVHNTSIHRTGSGIYTPKGVKVYHYDTETDSHLMLSELKSRPLSEPTYPAPGWSAYAKGIKPFSSEQSDFSGIITFDKFTFTELKRNAGSYTVCQKDLHCHLTYKMSEKTDEVYALGAFDGLHTVAGQYYLQICTLLKCQTTDLRTCGEPTGSASTKFEEFSLSGTFGMSYVFPQLILSGSQLAPERYYEVGGFQDNEFL